MSLFQRPLHYAESRPLDPATFFFCAEFAQLIITLSTDGTLHPGPARAIPALATSVLDWSLTTLGPLAIVLALLLILGFGQLGVLVWSTAALAVGAILTYLTAGPEALELFVVLTLVLRALIAVLAHFVGFPLRLAFGMFALAAVAYAVLS